LKEQKNLQPTAVILIHLHNYIHYLTRVIYNTVHCT